MDATAIFQGPELSERQGGQKGARAKLAPGIFGTGIALKTISMGVALSLPSPNPPSAGQGPASDSIPDESLFPLLVFHNCFR